MEYTPLSGDCTCIFLHAFSYTYFAESADLRYTGSMTATLTQGAMAPAWSAVDQGGVVYSSASCLGKWLLLYFYPKDDTPGCTIQACGIRDNFAAFAGTILVLGVSKDSVDSHKKFIKKYNLPFPLLVDTEAKLITSFQATDNGFGKRVSFLIDPQGVIRNIYTGFDCNVHASMVLADAKAAGA